MDLSHKLTDDELIRLEQEISEVYKRSTDEIGEKWREHMDSVRTKAAKAYDKIQKSATDEEKAAAVEDYKRILRNATLQNKHYAEMIDETTTRLAHVNEIALDYANDRMPKVYTINYNGSSEGFCEAVKGYSFTMCDEGTIRYLINNDKLLLPPKKLDPIKDKAWNTKKLNGEVLQGIIQGESVRKIADRVERVTEANRVSALRAARTMTTGAENKGRLDSYTNAERMGIRLKKRWMATLDDRTRHTHRVLDGQMRDKDKPFEIGGRSIMYPGDHNAAPDLVYNCRCTMVAEVEGTSSYPLKPEGKPAWADGMTDEEYSEWKNMRNGGIKEKRQLTRDENKGIISTKSRLVISMQFHGKPNFSKQTLAGLNKTIRSLSRNIEEHRQKISHPELIYSEWFDYTEVERQGYIKHWKKEIKNFEKQIKEAKAEIERRTNHEPTK